MNISASKLSKIIGLKNKKLQNNYLCLCTIFNFTTQLKFKKKSNFISRRPRGLLTSNKKVNCRTFYKLSFELKKSDKNAHAYSERNFVNKN